MNTKEIYGQIDNFIENIVNERETKTNKFYYVEAGEAKSKAKFIDLLNNSNDELKKRFTNFDTVLDLSFGSGNLTTHILLDNSIGYQRLILNDKFLEDCNTDLKGLLNCKLSDCDFFDKSCFEENSIDLLIFNPTHGGKPAKKDYVSKENKNFEALNETLERILKQKAVVIFRGSDEDFKNLYFSNFKYQNIYLDGDNSLFVVYDIETSNKKCYEYIENEFVINENCKKENAIQDEDLEIGEYLKELDALSLNEDKNSLVDSEAKHDVAKEKEDMEKENITKEFTNTILGKLTFSHKNLLLKGVPGTGKSQTIEDIIENELDIKDKAENICRINIHSASSNADLMQGIGIDSKGGDIEYKEKQGLIYNHIKKALFSPNQPFVLVLEEIQENSLNELIGDLIYLIEEKKRVTVDASKFEDGEKYEYQTFIEEVLKDEKNEHYIEIPYLVDTSTDYRKMVLPSNLYVFCTSNYRDDKKVIEDNLLRRFDVVEIYPKYHDGSWKNRKDELVFKSKDVSDFLEKLNKRILEKFETETHPDRYLIGHANWLDITDDDNKENKKLFYTALLKVIIEFKEIREVDFDTYTKEIVEDVLKNSELSDRIKAYIEACKFEYTSYKEMVEKLQKEIYSFLK